jgi:AraC-like DNA-binding protein
MHFHIIEPSNALAKFIKHYWVMEKQAYTNDVTERVIPTGNIELMFHYKNSFEVRSSNNCTYKQASSFLSGISSTFADVSTSGETGMICVTFHPFGACHFFNFPLHEIENQQISLDCIFGREQQEMNERLCSAQNMNERVSIIEAFLLRKLNQQMKHGASMIKAGVELINQHKGQINLTCLSEELSVSPKKLERSFSAMVGKTPKQFIKIVRFQSIINCCSSTNIGNLTQVAYENGYFDQAHFIKDFKTFSGLTPRDFFINYPCQSDYFS